MNPCTNFSLDEHPVRFTDGGNVYVIDAISALSEIDKANTIWNNLRTKKPEINQYVKYHQLTGGVNVPITDSAGWGKIQIILFDYLIDTATR
nr:hypothetical protein [uncultured Desulfobacter sp.]